MEEKLKTMKDATTVVNKLIQRELLARSFSKSYDGDRDLYLELGYKTTLTYEDFYAKFERLDVANRVVHCYPEYSWNSPPTIQDDNDPTTTTDFEKDVKDIVRNQKLFHYMHRLDVLQRLGSYAVLYMGYSDGEPSKELSKKAKLLWLRPVKETDIKVKTWVKRASDPRYGMPEIYELTLPNPTSTDSNITDVHGTKNIDVHWSRLIHVAEDTFDNDLYGKSCLEPIFNRLSNIELITGGSAEMFWRGAFPGLNFQLDADAAFRDSTQEGDTDTTSPSSLRKQIFDYVHGLSRVLRTQGMEVKELSPQVADPSKHFDIQIACISIQTGIPRRILTGSERGKLASAQDEKTWLSKVESRNVNFVEPSIIRPFIDRQIEYGIIAPPKEGEYTVKWTDIFSLDDKTRAEIGEIRSRALAQYGNSPYAPEIMPVDSYLREIIGFSKEQIEEIGKDRSSASDTEGGGNKDDINPKSNQEDEISASGLCKFLNNPDDTL